MRHGIKEKDICDFKKYAGKLADVIRRIQGYNPGAHIYARMDKQQQKDFYTGQYILKILRLREMKRPLTENEKTQKVTTLVTLFHLLAFQYIGDPPFMEIKNNTYMAMFGIFLEKLPFYDRTLSTPDAYFWRFFDQAVSECITKRSGQLDIHVQDSIRNGKQLYEEYIRILEIEHWNKEIDFAAAATEKTGEKRNKYIKAFQEAAGFARKEEKTKEEQAMAGLTAADSVVAEMDAEIKGTPEDILEFMYFFIKEYGENKVLWGMIGQSWPEEIDSGLKFRIPLPNFWKRKYDAIMAEAEAEKEGIQEEKCG